MSSRDTIKKTLIVAFSLSVACAIVVSSAAVALRETQEKNKLLDKKRNILLVAGLEFSKPEIEALFAERIETKIIELSTGEFTENPPFDILTYDPKSGGKDPELSDKLELSADFGGIGRLPRFMPVYLVKNEQNVSMYIFPIYGKGLWSTLYGFLAVKPDFNTIDGISYYEHAETPGLGGEVDNPNWKKLWKGKHLFDESGKLRIHVIKGQVPAGSPTLPYDVDGLSGATITARGVSNMMKFWFGQDGYGPFIHNQRAKTGGS